jgi:uncharacterized membrane protein
MEESSHERIEPRQVFRHNEVIHNPQSGNQRWLPMLLGSGLLLSAVRSRHPLPYALAGGTLIYCAVTNRWPFANLFGLGYSGMPRQRATSVPHGTGIKEERAVFINAEPREIYRFWRNLENLPRFMNQHVAVEQLDYKRSRWKVESVAGTTFEWTAEIINQIPDELLAWRSLEGADLDHAGSVHFEKVPSGGTKVKVIMEYHPPAGRVGVEVARLFGENPGQLVDKSLHRLKRLVESGQAGATASHQVQGSDL